MFRDFAKNDVILWDVILGHACITVRLTARGFSFFTVRGITSWRPSLLWGRRALISFICIICLIRAIVVCVSIVILVLLVIPALSLVLMTLVLCETVKQINSLLLWPDFVLVWLAWLIILRHGSVIASCLRLWQNKGIHDFVICLNSRFDQSELAVVS